jgi:hypothetical protein
MRELVGLENGIQLQEAEAESHSDLRSMQKTQDKSNLKLSGEVYQFFRGGLKKG